MEDRDAKTVSDIGGWMVYSGEGRVEGKMGGRDGAAELLCKKSKEGCGKVVPVI